LEGLELQKFDSILILADEALETNMQTADSRSLASLLLIRDIIKKSLPLEAQIEPSENERILATNVHGNGSQDKKEIIHDGSDNYESKNGYRNNTGMLNVTTKTLRLDSDSSISSSDDEWREHFKTIKKNPKGEISVSRKGILMTKNEDKTIGSISRQTFFPVIISEILDSRTKSLISVAQVSDYVMSNEIVASAMAMISEDRNVNRILSELLSSSGNEIITRSCLHYCRDGESLCFWEIVTRSRNLGQVAIGYKAQSEEKATLNPQNKSSKRTWMKGDLVVVLSKE